MQPRIKIGFDAKRVFQNFTGLGNYSRTHLATLNQYAPNLGLHLFAPKKNDNPRCLPFLADPYHTHFPDTKFKAYWRTKGILKDLHKNKIQIYHGLSHELPVGIEQTNIKTVVTIHDLIFKKYPEQFKPWDRWIYEKKFRSACQRADVVVAISESTRQDIIDLFGIPKDKIRVIYQSIHKQFFVPTQKEKLNLLQKNFALPENYFLYVGSVIPRKNLGLVVEAYKQIMDPNFPPLMIVGKGNNYRQSIETFIKEHNLSTQIRFLDAIEFADLPALYAGAMALCYPSVYEGFGLPLVEALSQQTPCITFQGSSLPEASGPGAIYLESLDAEAVANALTQLAENPELAKKLAQEGHQHIRQFQAAGISGQWKALYEGLL